jgi:proline dehydrogenase
MIDSASKAVFHLLARSRSLQRLASRYGLSNPRSFARRFIAGETIDEAVDAARAVEARGLGQTLDYLGESASRAAEADAATREYLTILDRIVAAGVGRNISLKLTQLGLDLDRVTAIDNLRRILEPATTYGFFVRIDMENSPYTDVTLDIFETLWGLGYRNLGVVLQSALRRSEGDLRRVLQLGARVRLVKGAYKESASVAYQRKAEVDEAFVAMMQTLLKDGTFPALATHDPAIIAAAQAFVAREGIGKERFEFQMLYGVRRDLQASLVSAGYGVRVYIPFGAQWFPYFMRRLGERPANVGFVLRSLLREQPEV